MTRRHLPTHPLASVTAVGFARRGPAWPRFDIARFDGDPPTPPAPPPAPPAGPPVDDGLGDAGKKALDAERKARKDAETELAKLRKAEQDRLDADKTETERLTAARDAADKRAAEAVNRAAKAEVKALADGFADRDDAVLMLGDLGQYVKDGDVDVDAIKAALADVLTRKPHLAAAAGPRNPAPDGSQGRGGTNPPDDFRKADKATFDAELAKFGLRPRS
jgi:hypothetical protein